ncbi:MAG TPA: XRE family transcriptional regulator [Xanthobacteraceae bacterium]|nr:XRE family transcriptional regulator [Xanthobacteraceae bacterium]
MQHWASCAVGAEVAASTASMALRQLILTALRQQIEDWHVTQSEAARRLGITQPRVNDLLRGRVSNFSLDALVNLAEQSGLTVRLELGEPVAA